MRRACRSETPSVVGGVTVLGVMQFAARGAFAGEEGGVFANGVFGGGPAQFVVASRGAGRAFLVGHSIWIFFLLLLGVLKLVF
jgi:hypothetical protein